MLPNQQILTPVAIHIREKWCRAGDVVLNDADRLPGGEPIHHQCRTSQDDDQRSVSSHQDPPFETFNNTVFWHRDCTRIPSAVIVMEPKNKSIALQKWTTVPQCF